MAKYKYTIYYSSGETEESEESFDSEEDARDAALNSIAEYEEGGEILNLSNPGDYPNPDETTDYEIFEI